MQTFVNQIRSHSVALVSLAVALSSLAYNTWRNEKTEANRNVRVAGIELLLRLGDLERIVFFSHYDPDKSRGNPREGWSYALTIRDLGALTAEPAISSSSNLVTAWEHNWAGLGSDDDSAGHISTSIDRLRDDLRTVLSELE